MPSPIRTSRNRFLQLRVRGAGSKTVAQFDRAQRQLQDELNAGLDRLGGRVVRAVVAGDEFPLFPEDTGQLRRSVRARAFFRARQIVVTITAEARREGGGPGSGGRGFDYVGVTRFGHRKALITPKRRRHAAARAAGKRGASLKVHIEGHDKARALRMGAVRGYRPDIDWAVDVQDFASRHAAAEAERIGRRVTTRILGP